MADLTLHRSGDLVVVTATGAYDIEDGRAVFQRLAATVAPGERTCILVDLHATQRQISYAAIYRLLEEVRAAPGAEGQRIAVVNRWQNQFEGSQFFEASGQHAGLQFRAFTDPEAAVRWLFSPEAPPDALGEALALVQRTADAGSDDAGSDDAGSAAA